MAKQKSMSTTISEGEKLADFGNGLKIRFNTEASQPYAISLKPIDDEISELERRVIWKWCGEWHPQSTEWSTKEECYAAFKYFFLWPRIANDHADLAALIERNKNLIPDLHDRALILGELLSRDDATHDQFHEALQAMWDKITAHPMNIVLTKPVKYHDAIKRARETGKTQTVKK